jgi:hypothetical protein
MSKERLYAVLSGDIVESRRYIEKSPAMRDAIKRAYLECAETFDDALGRLPGVDVFAGDSWQMAANSPACALRIALCMRALVQSTHELPGVDTRVAVGIGTIDYIGEDRVSMSQGEAFVLSGESLRRLEHTDTCRLAAVVSSGESEERSFTVNLQHTLNAMMLLLDVICTDWTASQAKAVAGALRDWTQKESAEAIGISQPAVSQSLRGAHYSAVQGVLDWWENVFSARDALNHGFARARREEMR